MPARAKKRSAADALEIEDEYKDDSLVPLASKKRFKIRDVDDSLPVPTEWKDLHQTWNSFRLTNLCSDRSAVHFEIQLLNAAQTTMPEFDADDARTRFIHLLAATVRLKSVTHLKSGLTSIINDCSCPALENIMTAYNTTPGGRQLLPQTKTFSNLDEFVIKDETWTQLRKMTLGHNLVSHYRAACDQAEIPGSAIARECDVYIAKRTQITGQSRKPSETNRAIVKTMVANHLYGIEDYDIGSSRAAAKLKTWENRLHSMMPFWEIASLCGGPGVFLLIPEKSIEV